MRVTYLVVTAAAMRALGRALGAGLPSGALVLLRGPLGAGKTTLAGGIAAGLGIAEPVISPTFTLVREYALEQAGGPRASATPHGRHAACLVHMDFYRLSDAGGAMDVGLADYLSGDDIVVIEWPERAGAALPDEALTLDISREPLDATDGAVSAARRVTVRARGLVAVAALAALRAALADGKTGVEGVRLLEDGPHA